MKSHSDMVVTLAQAKHDIQGRTGKMPRYFVIGREEEKLMKEWVEQFRKDLGYAGPCVFSGVEVLTIEVPSYCRVVSVREWEELQITSPHLTVSRLLAQCYLDYARKLKEIEEGGSDGLEKC